MSTKKRLDQETPPLEMWALYTPLSSVPHLIMGVLTGQQGVVMGTGCCHGNRVLSREQGVVMGIGCCHGNRVFFKNM